MHILKLALLTALIVSLPGCSKQAAPTKAAAAGPMAVPVTVASVVQRSMPVQLRAIGNVQPYRTVSVRCEVGGQLQKVNFSEGQDVHRGDELFVIDPRPFAAALQQAEANLEKDKAAARNAEV